VPPEKPTVERLWELLHAYKTRHHATDASLLLKDNFLDVITLEKAIYLDGKRSSLFEGEDAWYEFTAIVIDCLKTKRYARFVRTYLGNYGFKVDFIKSPGKGITWWLESGSIGDTFFTKPGAVLVEESSQYWIFALLPRETFGRLVLDAEIEGLVELAADLEF
jgi:hypothetical protein